MTIAQAVFVDVINVSASGITGMTILVFYRPNFLVYHAFLLGGFALVAPAIGQGGVQATKTVLSRNYAVMAWIEDIANNRLYFKANWGTPFLLATTDQVLKCTPWSDGPTRERPGGIPPKVPFQGERMDGVFVTNDPSIGSFVDHRIVLGQDG